MADQHPPEDVLRALEELRDSEERFRLVAENAYDVIWTMAPDGTITYVSPAVMRMRGITPEEAALQTLEQIHPPDSVAINQAYWASLFQALAEGGELPVFRGELEYYRKDGSLMVGELHVTPQVDAEGRLVRILGVTRDVTDKVRAERALANSLELLAESQQIANLGSWTLDLKTGESFWSRELFHILGLTPPEDPNPGPVHQPQWELLPEFLGEREAAELREAVAANVRSAEVMEVEIGFTRADGRPGRAISRVAAILDADGQVVGQRGTVSDITTTWEAGQARARRVARRADYLARVEHALRTNLSVIEGWAELLEEDDPDPEVRRAAIAAIQRNVAALTGQVEALMTEERFEKQAETLQLTAVDVAAAAARVVEDYAALPASPSIVATPAAGVVALGDTDALETIVRHLLENAIRFAGPEGNVGVQVAPAGDSRVELRVRDDGPGISPDVALFTAFAKGEGSTGHGLGLHVVRTLVEALGGTVSGANREDRGAEFVVTLAAPEDQPRRASR